MEPGLPFIETRYVGVVDDAQLMDYYRELYRRPNLDFVTSELVDLSDADLGLVSTAGLSSLASFVVDELARLQLGSARTAIYAPYDLPFGVARMYEAWSDHSPEEVRVFRDRDDAVRWLKTDVKET